MYDQREAGLEGDGNDAAMHQQITNVQGHISYHICVERRESINQRRALAAARKRPQLARLKNTHLIYRKKDGLCQAFQHGDIALVKSESLIGEDFQQTDDLSVIPDGCREDGSNTESMAALWVHARVGLCIIAA
ncbi:MAG TPA: hypothetical protein VMO80_10520 [Terriglobales bacterium]|nr:hypothetical protein [Terriglobales bacterium]